MFPTCIQVENICLLVILERDECKQLTGIFLSPVTSLTSACIATQLCDTAPMQRNWEEKKRTADEALLSNELAGEKKIIAMDFSPITHSEDSCNCHGW